MESSRLTYLLNNTYVPPAKLSGSSKIPDYHPCLVLHDKLDHAGKTRPCGCANDHCIKNAKDWIPRPKY